MYHSNHDKWYYSKEYHSKWLPTDIITPLHPHRLLPLALEVDMEQMALVEVKIVILTWEEMTPAM